MPDAILDPSLALRWILPDEHSLPADQAMTQWGNGELRAVVPHLFWAELINGLYQAQRQQRLSWDEVMRGVDFFIDGGLPTVDFGPGIYRRALEMAGQHGPAATYDFVYVALAQSLDIEFWHCDRHLANLLEGHYSWVKYVG